MAGISETKYLARTDIKKAFARAQKEDFDYILVTETWSPAGPVYGLAPGFRVEQDTQGVKEENLGKVLNRLYGHVGITGIYDLGKPFEVAALPQEVVSLINAGLKEKKRAALPFYKRIFV